MNVVISVVGKDQTGILAKVAMACYENNANIIDVSQKVMESLFTMIMLVQWQNSTEEFHKFITIMEELGERENLKIYVMHEDIFNAMHTI